MFIDIYYYRKQLSKLKHMKCDSMFYQYIFNYAEDLWGGKGSTLQQVCLIRLLRLSQHIHIDAYD